MNNMYACTYQITKGLDTGSSEHVPYFQQSIMSCRVTYAYIYHCTFIVCAWLQNLELYVYTNRQTDIETHLHTCTHACAHTHTHTHHMIQYKQQLTCSQQNTNIVWVWLNHKHFSNVTLDQHQQVKLHFVLATV